MKYYAYVIASVLWVSCSLMNQCNSIERKIRKICVNQDSVYSINIGALTKHKWSVLYIINGPKFSDDVENIVKDDYSKDILDDQYEFIYMHEGKIVKTESSTCSNFEWGKIIGRNGFFEVRVDSYLNFRKSLIEGEWMLYEAISPRSR